MRFVISFILLFSPVLLFADMFLSQNQLIVVESPWARATTSQAKACGVFLEIQNQGNESDKLIRAKSDIAGRVELHNHVIDEKGIMKMREVPFIEVPAKGKVALKPGSLHVMFFGLKKQLVEGAHFPLTLYFEKAGPVKVVVQVSSISANHQTRCH